MRNALTALVLAAAVGAPLIAADTFEVDQIHSSALFKVNHLGASNFWGRFNDVSGAVTWDGADAAKSSVKITVKADSVDTNQKDRDAHLKGPDFFNTKQFPEFSFVSKSVTKVDDKTFTVAGDLTLAGTTKPLTVTVNKVGEAEVPKFGHRLGLETSFTVKRSDFGIKGVPGVGDDVTVIFSLEGVKK